MFLSKIGTANNSAVRGLLAAVGTILIIVNLSAGEGTRRRNNYA